MSSCTYSENFPALSNRLEISFVHWPPPPPQASQTQLCDPHPSNRCPPFSIDIQHTAFLRYSIPPIIPTYTTIPNTPKPLRNIRSMTHVARMIIWPLSEIFPLLIQTSWCKMIDSQTESACSSLAPFSNSNSLATIPPLN